jgi:NUMOD3 motif
MKNLAKGRKHSKEVKEAMSINRKGDKNSFFNKNHSLKTLSLMKTAALNRKNPSNLGSLAKLYLKQASLAKASER